MTRLNIVTLLYLSGSDLWFLIGLSRAGKRLMTVGSPRYSSAMIRFPYYLAAILLIGAPISFIHEAIYNRPANYAGYFIVVLTGLYVILQACSARVCENGIYFHGLFISWHRIRSASWSSHSVSRGSRDESSNVLVIDYQNVLAHLTSIEVSAENPQRLQDLIEQKLPAREGLQT